MPVTVHKGDLFATNITPPVYAHGVNCAGAMGKGIALLFRQKFPMMYEAYRKRCRDGLVIPGCVWLWEETEMVPQYNLKGQLDEIESPVFVYNLAIKSHWRFPATYNAVEASLKNMVESMEERGLAEVAMPWIGCGLGGLDQKFVKKLMDNAVKDSHIQISIYEK